jgi:uncharacterized protein (DUF924 family)
MMAVAAPSEIVSLWRQTGDERWFEKDDDFDRTVTSRFLPTYEAGSRGELAAWETNAEDALALVIVLDQFPRNMFRGSARAFAADPLARVVADRALARGFDKMTEQTLRQFFYLPFMHAELLADQNRSVQLYESYGDADSLRHAMTHRDIILKFGRFPHRNQILGRATTAAEDEFLKSGGFAG